jgi:hypothetical protein
MTKSPTAKSTIKNDPFAAVIPMPSELETPDPPTPPAQAGPPVRPAADRRPERLTVRERPTPVHAPPAVRRRVKEKLTVHVSPELADRVKNAAYWNPRLTIAGIAEKGIRQEMDRLERENGGPYPPRDGNLTGGRPIK